MSVFGLLIDLLTGGLSLLTTSSLGGAKAPPQYAINTVNWGLGNVTSGPAVAPKLGGETLGGSEPFISLWGQNGNELGSWTGHEKKFAKPGFPYSPEIVTPDQQPQQAQYAVFSAQGTDAICLQYITVSGDSISWGWTGDVGAVCGYWWYPATNMIGQNHAPKCIWLSNNRARNIPHRSLSLHMPDFGQSDGLTKQFNNFPQTLCNATFRMKWSDLPNGAKPPILNPPFAYKNDGDGSDLDMYRIVDEPFRSRMMHDAAMDKAGVDASHNSEEAERKTKQAIDDCVKTQGAAQSDLAGQARARSNCLDLYSFDTCVKNYGKQKCIHQQMINCVKDSLTETQCKARLDYLECQIGGHESDCALELCISNLKETYSDIEQVKAVCQQSKDWKTCVAKSKNQGRDCERQQEEKKQKACLTNAANDEMAQKRCRSNYDQQTCVIDNGNNNKAIGFCQDKINTKAVTACLKKYNNNVYPCLALKQASMKQAGQTTARQSVIDTGTLSTQNSNPANNQVMLSDQLLPGTNRLNENIVPQESYPAATNQNALSQSSGSVDQVTPGNQGYGGATVGENTALNPAALSMSNSYSSQPIDGLNSVMSSSQGGQTGQLPGDPIQVEAQVGHYANNEQGIDDGDGIPPNSVQQQQTGEADDYSTGTNMGTSTPMIAHSSTYQRSVRAKRGITGRGHSKYDGSASNRDRDHARDVRKREPQGHDDDVRVAPRANPWPDHINISHHAQHKASEVCGSDSSYGPDFVAVKEGYFCDMSTKQLWPLCAKASDTHCFDLVKRAIRGADARLRKRDGAGRILPVKIYATENVWE